VAVAAFLDEELGFSDIPAVIEDTLTAMPTSEPHSLDDVQAVDEEARSRARACMRNKRLKTGAIRA
jgi:1-deoxy-D-xylulose-5-phosphate reductoisomerase